MIRSRKCFWKTVLGGRRVQQYRPMVVSSVGPTDGGLRQRNARADQARKTRCQQQGRREFAHVTPVSSPEQTWLMPAFAGRLGFCGLNCQRGVLSVCAKANNLPVWLCPSRAWPAGVSQRVFKSPLILAFVVSLGLVVAAGEAEKPPVVLGTVVNKAQRAGCAKICNCGFEQKRFRACLP